MASKGLRAFARALSNVELDEAATRRIRLAVQGLSAGAQLWLSASEQQMFDCAVAGGVEGDSRRHEPDVDEAASAVSVRVLWCADAGAATADCATGAHRPPGSGLAEEFCV